MKCSRCRLKRRNIRQFNLRENIKQADFIIRFCWRKAMSCKNAALCSAEHAESISGLSIEQGRVGMEMGGGLENSWARHLFLRPPPPTHARSHRSNSNCQRHILTSAVGGRISWQTSTRPRLRSHLTRTRGHPCCYTPPPVSHLSYFWPQLITLTKKKKPESIFYHKGAANACRCIVCVFHLNIDSGATLEPSGLWSVSYRHWHTHTLMWRVLHQRETCFKN